AGEVVRKAEEGAGDDHEANGDRCGLANLPTIRPLYSLQLAPASSQEGGQAVALARLACARGAPATRGDDLGPVLGVAVGAFLERLLGVVDAVLQLLELLLVGELRQVDVVVDDVGHVRGRRIDQLGAADLELRLGQVDLAACELRRLMLVQVLRVGCRGGRSGRRVGGRAWLSAARGTCLAISALLRSSAVAGHGRSRSASLPMRR